MHSLSYHSVLLTMVTAVTGAELALGTGFIYEHDNTYYLITNGHNITGVNPDTGERLANHAAFPTHILRQYRFNNKLGVNDNMRAKMLEKGLDIKHALFAPPKHEKHKATGKVVLYEDDDYTEPRWYMHPVYGHRVDVVAIPMGDKDELAAKAAHIEWFPINKNELLDTEVEVSDDVYILGYPFGITDSFELPIWKKGSVATEPSMDYKELPIILVDTASRSGMSGSPVILKRTGIHGFKDGKPEANASIGTAFGFVGVYSGRIGAKEEFSAQLGIVWKKKVIDEIIEAKVKGATDFQ